MKNISAKFVIVNNKQNKVNDKEPLNTYGNFLNNIKKY